MIIRYLLYLVRWQLSTPLLAFCVVYFRHYGDLWSTIIANLLGGLIFFWIDKFIFSGKINEPIWAIKENIVCSDCGKIARGYRLVAAHNYDRRDDPKPKFRCEECSAKKMDTLRNEGVGIE